MLCITCRGISTLTHTYARQVYLNTIKAASEKGEARDCSAFTMMPFECSSNGEALHANH